MRTPALPPPMPVREARRFARQVQSEVLGGVARTLGSVPERRLAQAMRTPLRRVVLDLLFWGLPRVLNGTRAGEVTSSVRCHITGRGDGTFDVYSLEFLEGRWQAGRGSPVTNPELTVTVDGTELLRLACGSSSPLEAYLGGKLRASGDPTIAARLTMLFRSLSAPSPAA